MTMIINLSYEIADAFQSVWPYLSRLFVLFTFSSYLLNADSMSAFACSSFVIGAYTPIVPPFQEPLRFPISSANCIFTSVCTMLNNDAQNNISYNNTIALVLSLFVRIIILSSRVILSPSKHRNHQLSHK